MKTSPVPCGSRLAPPPAAYRLGLATELTRLPATLDLLERGEIGTHHARHLAETVIALDDATATAIETAVLGKAPEQTLATFKRAVRKAVLRAAPKRAEERHVEAMTQRRVVRTPDSDGMSGICDAAARHRRYDVHDRYRRPGPPLRCRRPADR